MCVCVCVCLHWETKSQKIIHDMILSEITFSPQPSPVPRKVETVSYSVVSNSLQLHGLLYARILEWVAIPFSRGSSRPRDQTEVSCFAVRFFTIWVIIGHYYMLGNLLLVCSLWQCVVRRLYFLFPLVQSSLKHKEDFVFTCLFLPLEVKVLSICIYLWDKVATWLAFSVGLGLPLI